MKDPFPSNDIGAGRFRHKLPSAVRGERGELLLHGGHPVGVTKSTAHRAWDGGDWLGGDSGGDAHVVSIILAIWPEHTRARARDDTASRRR